MKNKLFDGVKWLFFDVGSVLADETPVHEERFRRILPQIREITGRDMTFEEFGLLMDEGGLHRVGAFGYAARKLGVRGPLPYLDEYEIPYPDSEEAVRKLSSAYKLGIIANQRPGLAERLDRLGYAGLFEKYAIFGSGDCGMEKPGADIFRAALAAAGCAPREAVMIGDRADNDVAPAHLAGMGAVRLITGSYRDDRPRNELEKADLDVCSLSELADAALGKE